MKAALAGRCVDCAPFFFLNCAPMASVAQFLLFFPFRRFLYATPAQNPNRKKAQKRKTKRNRLSAGGLLLHGF